MSFYDITAIVGDFAVPKKFRKSVNNYLDKAGIKKVPYYHFGLTVYLLLILSFVTNIFILLSRFFGNVTFIIMLFLSLFLIPVIFVFYLLFFSFAFKLFLDNRAYHRVKKMEEVLPEFLSELSLNLKAGLTLQKALANSTEQEFGILSSEIQQVTRKIELGEDTDTALKEFSEKYNSPIIEESFSLVMTSWKKGVNTPPLLDRIVDNLEEVRFLRKKVIASVTSYKIFLSIVTILITPAMFALSFYLIDLIRSITNRILLVANNIALPFAITAVRINDNHFIIFSTIAVVLVSLCSAAIISVIKDGNIKQYRQIMMYSAGALVSYRIFMFLFSIFFALFNVN